VSFRSNIRSNSPAWLQKWTALVLRIINEEYDLFLKELLDAEKKKLLKKSKDEINNEEKLEVAYLKCMA